MLIAISNHVSIITILFHISFFHIFQVFLRYVFDLYWGSLVNVALNALSRPCCCDVWIIENDALIWIEVVLNSSASKLVTFPPTSLSCSLIFIVQGDNFKSLLGNHYRSSIWYSALAVLHGIIPSWIIMFYGNWGLLFYTIEIALSFLHIRLSTHFNDTATQNSLMIVEESRTSLTFLCRFDQLENFLRYDWSFTYKVVLSTLSTLSNSDYLFIILKIEEFCIEVFGFDDSELWFSWDNFLDCSTT